MEQPLPSCSSIHVMSLRWKTRKESPAKRKVSLYDEVYHFGASTTFKIYQKLTLNH